MRVDLPGEIEKRIEETARKAGISKEEFIREAILQYLEDFEDVEIAEKALEEGGEAMTLEELMERMIRER